MVFIKNMFIFFIAVNFLMVALASCNEISAQESKSVSTYWGAKTHAGFIIPHSEAVEEISNSSPFGVQLDWSRLHSSQKAWENCNCYSKIGLSLIYYNFNNPEVLGSSFNLALFGEPYLNFRNDLFFTLRGGIGANYLTKVYDEETNPKNQFFSSSISFILLLNISANYRINNHWAFNLHGNYNHISNGGVEHPNKGMNFPTFGLGLDYRPDYTPFQKRDKITKEKWQLDGYARINFTRKTVKEDENFSEKHELLFGLAGGLTLQIANFNALSTGFEAIRDNTLSELAHRNGLDRNPYFLGWGIGHHLIFGRFNFNQQMLYYLYKPFDFTSHQFYQRYELAYQLNDIFLIGASLKAHGHVADNFDVRVGIVF